MQGVAVAIGQVEVAAAGQGWVTEGVGGHVGGRGGGHGGGHEAGVARDLVDGVTVVAAVVDRNRGSPRARA